MQSPDKKPQTLAADIEEDRLRQWREKRAKVAEASKQERIRIAEAERRDRLKVFEADKAQRIKDAAELRARQQAAEKAERMAVARSRIAGRTDIEAARKRLLAYRQKSAKLLALKLFLCVLCPTLGVALYLFTIATPLYSSQTLFALTLPSAQSETSNTSPIGSSQISREAHLLREVLISPEMQTILTIEYGFKNHFSATTIDPLTRIGTPLLSAEKAFDRYISVIVNGQDGTIRVETKARNPQTAQAFAQAMVNHATTWMSEIAVSNTGAPSLRLITKPTQTREARYPQKAETLSIAFLSFLALFVAVTIFGRTLLRHSAH